MHFKFRMEQVPAVIRTVQWGALAVSFLLLLADYFFAGMAIALSVLIGNQMLKRIGVKAWVIEKLTGVPRSAILELDRRRKNAGAPEDTHKQGTAAQLSPDKLAEVLDREQQPGILLKRHWPIGEVPVQNSWLGGVPKLPEGVDWPVNPDTGFALHHLAQIDLSEMPLPEDGPQLPRRGTLWFFADINEEMCWDEGPGTGHSAVLYSDQETAGCAFATVPDTLPEVDHEETRMTGPGWAFRPPRRHLYERWPVTGHLVPTWDQARLPEGLDHRSGYYEARQAREEQVRASVLGPKPERRTIPYLIEEAFEQVTGPDGTTENQRRGTYNPDAWGGRFPYTNGVAVEFLRDVEHVASLDLKQALRQVERAAADDREPGRLDAETAAFGPRILEPLPDLTAAFAALPPGDVADPALVERLDAMMSLDPDTYRARNWMGNPASAVNRVLSRAVTRPDLARNIPQEVIGHVIGTVSPAHGYTNHYLLGAKGMGANPTAGQGVRLLQLDSDYALEFMFCDCGIIDFWIAPEDLQAGRWDRAWAATAGG